jgi:NADPH2:quinone reductase
MLTPMLQARIHDQLDQTKILQQSARLIDEGKLKILVNQTFPLADASIAHKVLEAGGMKGKLVLTIE